MTAVPKKSSSFFISLLPSRPGGRRQFVYSPFTFTSPDFRIYLSDACSVAGRLGLLGRLGTGPGGSVAGPFLQLVPELGHLRAEQSGEGNISLSLSGKH